MKSQAVWGSSPPANPGVGSAWVDASQSSLSPSLYVHDGAEWNLIGIIDSLAIDLIVAPGIRVIDIEDSDTVIRDEPDVEDIAGAVDLLAYPERILVIEGSNSFPLASSMPGQVKILVFSDSLIFGAADIPRAAALVTSLGDVCVIVGNANGDGWRVLSFVECGLLSGELTLHVLAAGFGASAGFALPRTRFAYGSNPATVAAAARLGIGAFGGKYQIAVPSLSAWAYLAGNATVSH